MTCLECGDIDCTCDLLTGEELTELYDGLCLIERKARDEKVKEALARHKERLIKEIKDELQFRKDITGTA